MDNDQKSKGFQGCWQSCLTVVGGAFGLLIAIPVILILVELLLMAVGGFLIVADPITEVEAVVVLSGGDDDSRLEEAARLFEEVGASYVVLTETGETMPDSDVLLTKLRRQKAVELGIPDEAIIITEKMVSSTFGESRVVHKLLIRREIKSCVIVTDPFHTRRTRIMFRDEFRHPDRDYGISFSVRPVRNHWYRSSTWWMSQEGWEATFNEYVKLFGYLLGFLED